MEGDAGTSRLNPTDADEGLDESLAVSPESSPEQSPEPDTEETSEDRRGSRLGRGLVAAICAGLLVLAGAGAVAGYLLLKADQQSEKAAREEAAALQAARDCVAATHAPDVTAMS